MVNSNTNKNSYNLSNKDNSSKNVLNINKSKDDNNVGVYNVEGKISESTVDKIIGSSENIIDKAIKFSESALGQIGIGLVAGKVGSSAVRSMIKQTPLFYLELLLFL